MKNRKLYISIIVCLVSLFLMVSLTSAWLSQGNSSETVSVAGLSYTRQLGVHDKLVSVETKFKDDDDKWIIIGQDIENEVSVINYREDEISLIPGQRREFQTKVTNLTNDDVSFSSYLSGLYINSLVAEYIEVGVYAPNVYYYDYQDLDNSNTDYYYGSVLNFTDLMVLAPKKSTTIEWYVYLNPNYTDYSFLALTDSADNVITGTTQGGTDFYYCVTDYDGFTNTIYHAYKVNGNGDFIDDAGNIVIGDASFIEYNNGDYTNCKYKYRQALSLGYAFKIDGIKFAVGRN